jgi:hypothetical protein
VHEFSFPPSLILPEQADLSVGVPNRVTNPSTEVKDLSGHTKTGTLGFMFFDARYLISQLRGKSFIGVEGKNPGKFGFSVGKVFLIGEVGPFSREHKVRVFFSQLDRIIVAVPIHDNNLIGNSCEAFQSGLEALFLIVGDKDG